MGKKDSKLNNSSWIYCFVTDSGAVFLNRKDETIKSFNSYEEAILFASNNINLID